jgi:O-antigen/teichoic acid export membrane protein
VDGFYWNIIPILKWSGAGQIIRQLFQFVLFIILARLLDPEDFGLIAIITLFSNFVQLVSDMGFGSALIQKTKVEQEHLDSVFWMNVLIGVFATILFIVAAPMLSFLYNKPILKNLTSLVALNFTIASFSVVQRSLLYKAMNFKLIALIDMSSIFISGIVSIIAALSGYGVWSLVVQLLTFQSIQTIGLWCFSSWRPQKRFSLNSLRELSGYGLHLTGFNIFNYWVRNGDNFLIGKLLSAHALGIYSRAYSMMTLPVLQMTDFISQVMFPALSSIQNDIEEFKRVYLKAVRAIALVTCPMMAGLVVAAKPFILVLFGEKWHEVIPVFQILCIVGLIQGVGSTVGWIYTSLGRTDTMFKWGIFSGIIYISSFVIGIHWGILGVAIAYALSGYFILWYPSWAIPGRFINLGFFEMLSNIAGPLMCSLAMALCTLPFSLYSVGPSSQLAQLFLISITGSIAYFLCIHFFQLTAYREIRALIQQNIGNKGAT